MTESTRPRIRDTLGMAYTFQSVDRDQPFLLPPSLRDWLPADHLVWFVIDSVAQLDLGGFVRKSKKDDPRGRAALHPSMMLTLLVYAYCRGVRSSREIERLCREDVGYRIVCANLTPDHTTIARFRQRYDAEMETVFVEILRLCREAGMVKLGLVALDGTKIEANASLEANRTLASIEKEVRSILAEAERVDAAEDDLFGADRRGDELPAELADRNSRLERLRQAKQRLADEQSNREAKHQEHLQQRAEVEVREGRKLRGRKPKPPATAEDAQANVTDPESRIMKTRRGYVQGYNAQAIATREQVIVAAEVTDEANDVRQFAPMVEAMACTLRAAGFSASPVGTVLADAGYWSDANAAAVASLPIGDALIATTKDWKRRKALREQGPPRGRIPVGLNREDRMERRLRTQRGHTLYAQRGCIIEPVFGQGKDARGGRRFMRRGMEAVVAEFKLMCGAHNLLKMFTRARAAARTAEGHRVCPQPSRTAPVPTPSCA